MSRKRWPLIAAALVCLVLELVFVIWRPFRKVDTSRYIIATVARGPLEAGVKCAGTVVPLQQRNVASPVPACVDQVSVAVGEQVKQGQVLARLSSPDALAALQLAEASLRLNEAQLAQMGGRGTDTSAVAVGLAEQRLAKAELQLKQRQEDVTGLVTAAPADGVVATVSVAPGDRLAAGQAIVSVVDMQALEVMATISIYQYQAYQVGQIVQIYCAGAYRDGTVMSISPVATGAQRQFALVVAIGPGDAQFRPGLSATINPREAAATGTIAARTYNITARTAATVTRVSTRVGQEVTKGETLVELTSEQASIALRDAELEFVGAKAALASLQGQGTGDSAEIALQEARVEQARVQYLRAKSDVEGLTVTAPISGVITACNVRPGDETGMQPLFTVADLSGVVINATVNETDVVMLKAPMDARVVMTALPDSEYDATLVSVGMQPAQSSGPAAYPVRFEIAEASDIRPGMTGSVTILLARRESAVYVPSDALREQFDRIYLDVLRSDGEIVPVEVVVGITNGIYTEIISGVYEGQRVVIGSAKADSRFSVPSLWPTGPTSGR